MQGYADAAKWVYGQALEPDEWSDGLLISLNELRRIHHMALTPVWGIAPHSDATDAESPGNFREHDIRPFDAGMPTSWPEVPARVADWITDVVAVGKTASEQALNPPLPEQLARLHNDFERIHPFIDGNGRTGRRALNLILVRLGYPPVIVFKKQRDAYLVSLQKSDGGNHGPLGEMIARAMLDNLNRIHRSQRRRPGAYGPARRTLGQRPHCASATPSRAAWTPRCSTGRRRNLANYSQSLRELQEDQTRASAKRRLIH